MEIDIDEGRGQVLIGNGFEIQAALKQIGEVERYQKSIFFNFFFFKLGAERTSQRALYPSATRSWHPGLRSLLAKAIRRAQKRQHVVRMVEGQRRPVPLLYHFV